jgi:hypothetical protein
MICSFDTLSRAVRALFFETDLEMKPLHTRCCREAAGDLDLAFGYQDTITPPLLRLIESYVRRGHNLLWQDP